MKFIPILFSTPMVQAINDGRKTMTRRLIKPKPSDSWMENTKQFSKDGSMYDFKGKKLFWLCDEHSTKKDSEIYCPYGHPGDILWVREIYSIKGWLNGKEVYSYKSDNEIAPKIRIGDEWQQKWSPSIHMPKAACRIFLKVKSVRVEKLQDITEQDAKSEGVLDMFSGKDIAGEAYFNYMDKNGWYDCVADNAIHSFQTLWQSINGPESWEANPWVWVIEFEKEELTPEQKRKFLNN